jgi:ABC-type oligopeptide transport system substrate-binding subunit
MGTFEAHRRSGSEEHGARRVCGSRDHNRCLYGKVRLDRHAGVNIPNQQDPRIDALLDRLRQAGTEAEYLKVGEELQEYVTTQMIYMSVASLPSVEATRESVEGYVFLRGFKKRFETAWLEKPQG